MQVNEIFPPSIDFQSDIVICATDFTLNAGSSENNYIWQDGSTSPDFLVTESGNYSVEITNICGSASDAIQIELQSLPNFDLGMDTVLCTGETLLFDVTTEGASYAWQDNSTNSNFEVTQSGIYSVVVNNLCGTVSDAITVDYDLAPDFDLGEDQQVCSGTTILLDGTSESGAYLWEDGQTSPTLEVSSTDLYILTVSTRCASVTDSVRIEFFDPPDFDLGLDQTLCEGE